MDQVALPSWPCCYRRSMAISALGWRAAQGVSIMTLPDAKILETTVVPNADWSVVRLQISDGSPDPASGSIHLTLSVRIQPPRLARLAQVEHDAMDFANSVLADLVRQKKDELGSALQKS